MTKRELEELRIEKPSGEMEAQVKLSWDKVAKPLDSLGQFETVTARIGAIQGTVQFDIRKKAVIVMCADNGIVKEGVSQSGQEVTAAVAASMGKNRSSVGKMATSIGADVIPVDIGINCEGKIEGVLDKKVSCGTRDFLEEPAMTEEEALAAIQVGIELVKECKKKGYRLLATGEMGIGNTTTSSAVAAALTGCEPEEITGRGAGLSDAGLLRKKQVIRDALRKYRFRKEEALRILSCVGGLDIAGLAGVFIGGAICHIPVVMDGVISVVAALAAERLVPGVKDYVIASHKSREPAAARMLEELGVHPVIDASLALGEGTGAVMMFSLLDMAMVLYEGKTTFSDIEVEQYTRF